MELKTIKNSTPVKEFPGIYNGNIDSLISEINRLNNLISSKDTEIQNLSNQLVSLKTNLKADFSTWFDQKMNEFEETYAKSSDVYSKKQINDLFITKTEADNTFVKKTNN